MKLLLSTQDRINIRNSVENKIKDIKAELEMLHPEIEYQEIFIDEFRTQLFEIAKKF